MKNFEKLLLVFLLGASVALAETPSVDDPSEESGKAYSGTSAADVRKAESSILQPYKPVFFAYGNPLTKVQFSFKSQVYADFPLYMAYSQIIFWELGKDSKPFLDGTYNPEIFYRQNIGDGLLKSIDLGVWEHNSNGKAGVDSRSYDQSNMRFNFGFEGKKRTFEFSALVKYIYNNDETNRDIYDYIGPFEFQLRLMRILESVLDRTEFTFDFFPGGKYGHDWDKSGYQFGLNFHIGGIKVIPAFYIQYYTGYAETLINYNQRVDEARVGISF